MKNMGWIVVAALIGFGLCGCCCMPSGKGASSGGVGLCGKSSCGKCGLAGDKCPCAQGPMRMAEINTAALKALLDAKVPLTLLDARSGKYDDGRRIPGAQTLAPDAKDEDILAKLKSKDALIVTYCANLKCPASRTLAKKLDALGYKRVLVYPFGIEDWVAAGNTVTQPAK